MKIWDFTKLYGAILILHLGVLFVDDPNRTLIYVTKPLLLFSLLSFVVHKWYQQKIPAKSLLQTGLFFALMGDILLLAPDLLLPGMAAFLLCQVAYVGFFRQNLRKKSQILRADWLLLFFLLGLAAWVISIAHLPASWWRVAFGVYGIFLVLMVWTAFLRRHEVNGWGFWLTFLGALLFLVSDALLAQQLFSSADKFQKIAVMGTYGLGQFGIALGSLCSQEQVMKKQFDDDSTGN
jgi:uncharacterized membrane protein YhhN